MHQSGEHGLQKSSPRRPGCSTASPDTRTPLVLLSSREGSWLKKGHGTFCQGLLSCIFQSIQRSNFPDSPFASAVWKAESRLNHSINVHSALHTRTPRHFVSVSPLNRPETLGNNYYFVLLQRRKQTLNMRQISHRQQINHMQSYERNPGVLTPFSLIWP